MANQKEAVQVYGADIEGRVINGHMFVKNAYVDPKTQTPGLAMYKIEMAYDAAARDALEEAMANVIEAEWGKQAADDFFNGAEGYASPFRDGNDKAAARAARGKEGGAYKDKWVLQATTTFNLDGVDGPGGIAVYDANAEPIPPARQGEAFNGCYGYMAMTFKAREDKVDVMEGRTKKSVTIRTIKAYLKAFQVTRNDDDLKLTSPAANPFKPIARAGAAAGGERRRRG